MQYRGNLPIDANSNPIELCGTVAAVIYQNEENGYTVLKLDVDDGSQTMVVGCIPYAVPGESMIVTGSWMTHPVHGQQFKAEFAERTAGSPIHRIGFERWLRNIAVALGNAPASPAVRAALTARADHESALVREHVQWALKR